MRRPTGTQTVIVVGRADSLDLVEASIDFLIGLGAKLVHGDHGEGLKHMSQALSELHDEKQALIRKILGSEGTDGEAHDPLRRNRVLVTTPPGGTVIIASDAVENIVAIGQREDDEEDEDD